MTNVFIGQIAPEIPQPPHLEHGRIAAPFTKGGNRIGLVDMRSLGEFKMHRFAYE